MKDSMIPLDRYLSAVNGIPRNELAIGNLVLGSYGGKY